ncbi:MAG: hypothetical protein L0G69_03885 [Brevibacterium sp.]|nr:hypothetical protein [Brevibacterium sp.]MDN5605843.1 hypothetical protein [Kocuria sp.]
MSDTDDVPEERGAGVRESADIVLSATDRASADTESRSQRGSVLEKWAGIDAMPHADKHEQQVIIRALAIAFPFTRAVSLTIALVLIASGMWWAAILVIIGMGLPELAAKFYANGRGIDLFWQSGRARNETRVIDLILSLAYMAIVTGLVAFQSSTGHPLITWTWRNDFHDFGFMIGPIVTGLVIGTVIGWFLRRRRYRRIQNGQIASPGSAASDRKSPTELR